MQRWLSVLSKKIKVSYLSFDSENVYECIPHRACPCCIRPEWERVRCECSDDALPSVVQCSFDCLDSSDQLCTRRGCALCRWSLLRTRSQEPTHPLCCKRSHCHQSDTDTSQYLRSHASWPRAEVYLIAANFLLYYGKSSQYVTNAISVKSAPLLISEVSRANLRRPGRPD